MRRPQASPTRNDEIGDELALSGRYPGDEVRADDLRLDDPENPEWRPTFVLRGLKRLPASW